VHLLLRGDTPCPSARQVAAGRRERTFHASQRLTAKSINRYPGSVTYHSISYRRTWDPATATENVYHSNTSGGSGSLTIAPHGSTFAFGVSYTSGDSTWSALPVVALREVIVSREPVESCSVYDYEHYYSRSCSALGFHTRSLVGREAFGPPYYDWIGF
jgi:hypothetical protein